MIGVGTIANVAAIAVGSFLGLILKRGIPESYSKTVMEGIGLCVVIIGIQMALKTENIILVIVSLALGAILGEFIAIEAKLTGLGTFLEKHCLRLSNPNAASGSFVQGFVGASLVFVVGAMAIVGSFQDGLLHDPTTLYAKATLDGIFSVLFAANWGVGVAFSALSVGLYQGMFTLLASYLEPLLSPHMITELTATGGVLIIAISTNLLKLTTVRVGNLLPALVIVAVLAKFF